MAEQRVQRRLAAILAADVVGYSRLMGEDETGTLAQLKTLRKEVFDPRIADHNGRIVKTTGDGVLVEFASAVDATECAIKIQRSLARRNEDVPEGHRIELRIGINLGDIIVDGDDIYGDGVNVAARLEALSDAGGVYVSAAVHDQVEGKVEVAFEDLGEHTVKNIDKPIGVHRVSSEPRRVDTTYTDRGVDKLFERPAVAVLPFENIGGDPEQEYFADGLTEDIITALSLWRSFPVIARNSTFAYKGQSPDIRKVGEELGARYVIEGSVRRAGQRLRVTAQLIDARSGHHVWAERYDRELADIFDLQDDLTKQIAAIIAPELERAEQRRFSTFTRRVNLEAWELLQRGIAQFYAFNAENNAQAKQTLTRAIEIDPNYSQAYSWLTFIHMRDYWLGYTEDRERSLAETSAAGKKAVELDSSDSLAHVALSIAHTWTNRLDLAQREAEIAVDLNPNNANAYGMLGHVLGTIGKTDEALRNSKLALLLNPIDPRNAIFIVHIATSYLIAGDYQSAATWADDAIQRSAAFAEAHFLHAVALGHLGQVANARAALTECEKLTPDFVAQFGVSRPYLNRAVIDGFLDGLRKAGWEG